ncbi:MAG: hypothetical protein ACQEWD_06900 [Bacteroidota bacterium]
MVKPKIAMKKWKKKIWLLHRKYLMLMRSLKAGAMPETAMILHR